MKRRRKTFGRKGKMVEASEILSLINADASHDHSNYFYLPGESASAHLDNSALVLKDVDGDTRLRINTNEGSAAWITFNPGGGTGEESNVTYGVTAGSGIVKMGNDQGDIGVTEGGIVVITPTATASPRGQLFIDFTGTDVSFVDANTVGGTACTFEDSSMTMDGYLEVQLGTTTYYIPCSTCQLAGVGGE